MKINLISIIFMVIFAVCSVVDLYCLIKEDKKKNKIFKPMLMPLLAVCYVLTANHVKPLVIAALLLGCAGDTFLLGEGIWFAAGLLAFLAGHICYMISFIRVGLDSMAAQTSGTLQITSTVAQAVGSHTLGASKTAGMDDIALLFSDMKFTAVIYISFLILAGIIVIRKLPGKMILPVYIYALALVGTSFMANVCMRKAGNVFIPAFVGSLFFIVSDSMIGIDVFIKEHGHTYKMMIMLTYIIAQTLITFSWALCK